MPHREYPRVKFVSLKKIVGFTSCIVFAASAHADWQYTTSTDPMTSKAMSLAVLESNNSLELSFPYNGSNYGRIAVRQHPQDGLAVIISVGKGQILCSAFSTCDVLIRFDDKPAARYPATPSSDGNPRFVFLKYSSGFIKEARNAKSTLVQLDMFQQGSQVLRFFSAKPLDWPEPPSPNKPRDQSPPVGALKLAGDRMCFACHHASQELIGPSFDDIRARYNGKPAASVVLIASILHGSENKWGGIPMPQNTHVSPKEAERLANWILKGR